MKTTIKQVEEAIRWDIMDWNVILVKEIYGNRIVIEPKKDLSLNPILCVVSLRNLLELVKKNRDLIFYSIKHKYFKIH